METLKSKLFSGKEIKNLHSIMGGTTWTCDGANCDQFTGKLGSNWCDDITDTDCNTDHDITASSSAGVVQSK